MNKKENSSKYLPAMFENVSVIVLHFQKSLKRLPFVVIVFYCNAKKQLCLPKMWK